MSGVGKWEEEKQRQQEEDEKEEEEERGFQLSLGEGHNLDHVTPYML